MKYTYQNEKLKQFRRALPVLNPPHLERIVAYSIRESYSRFEKIDEPEIELPGTEMWKIDAPLNDTQFLGGMK